MDFSKFLKPKVHDLKRPAKENDREYTIVFKKHYIKEYVMPVKGWKTYSDVAKFYQKTRQYMNMLDNQTVPASSEIIARTAVFMGNIKGSWNIPFEIVSLSEKANRNHPRYNLSKHNGEVPYDHFSTAYEFRKNDQTIEKI